VTYARKHPVNNLAAFTPAHTTRLTVCQAKNCSTWSTWKAETESSQVDKSLEVKHRSQPNTFKIIP